jgi:predicted RNA-binding Zn-ribbon protein involved in translation (DUF1610 family)
MEYDLMFSTQLIQNCQVCGQALYISEQLVGQVVGCPQCGATLVAEGESTCCSLQSQGEGLWSQSPPARSFQDNVLQRDGLLRDSLLTRVDTILNTIQALSATRRHALLNR